MPDAGFKLEGSEWKPQRKFVRTYQGNGAKKGLEMKMDYWAQKDVKMEFNILTAQAVNLAVQIYKRTPSIEEVRDCVRVILQARTDAENKKMYEDFSINRSAEVVTEETK